MSLYIISLSLFIFITSITTSFKIFFVKKDNLLKNIINFAKYTGISFFIFFLSFIMLSILNSDLNFKLFTDLRMSFIILFCFLLYSAFNIFNEKNNISVEQYRKDDLSF